MYWTEFFTIAVAHLVAVASPGPDFAVVMRQSVTAGTKAALWTSLGVGSGIFLHVGYCLLGVSILLSQSPRLFVIMKYIAALYLLSLGMQSIRSSFSPSSNQGQPGGETVIIPSRAFAIGFLTNGLNPKATLFFLALFTVVVDVSTPLIIQLAYGVYLAVATFAWFAMLSLLLGRGQLRNFMIRSGAWFERVMGVVLVLLAVQIAFTA